LNLRLVTIPVCSRSLPLGRHLFCTCARRSSPEMNGAQGLRVDIEQKPTRQVAGSLESVRR